MARNGRGNPATLLITAFVIVILAAAPAQETDEATSPTASRRYALEPLATAIRESIIEKLPFEIHGFVEARGGVRLQDNKQIARTATIGETRLQLETTWWLDWAAIKLKSDFYYDGVEKDARADLREANITLTPFEFMDLKIGRQVLTWGTGDMLFINDLFPKDWNSFFIGRDDEYLKAPSDAVKAGFFSDIANLDIVYVPQFDPDRYITGKKISYWSDMLGRHAGTEDHLNANEPERWFRDDEIHARIYKNIRGYEAALYYYNGFWKSPGGMDPISGKALFPRLNVYGASMRGNLFKGIGNLEAGYYDSANDRSGRDPFINNSQFRVLAGYEQELARDLTGGFQYYIEHMTDHGAYSRTLPDGAYPDDRTRHVMTLRLTKMLMNQNLKMSLFLYYSPSDNDAYLRPKVHYKFSDSLSGEVGANVFLGSEDQTFFGQFEDNTNIYAAMRWNF